MSEQTYTRRDLGVRQFETALRMFIAGEDRASVITLAGAADTILTEVLRREHGDTFTDHLIRVYESGPGKETPSFGSVTTRIHKMMRINHLKHFDKNDPPTIDADLDACALGALAKAVAAVYALGDRPDLCEAFKQWVIANENHPSLVQARADVQARPKATRWPAE